MRGVLGGIPLTRGVCATKCHTCLTHAILNNSGFLCYITEYITEQKPVCILGYHVDMYFSFVIIDQYTNTILAIFYPEIAIIEEGHMQSKSIIGITWE